MSPRMPRLPAWTASLTWKATVFITVMCCALAALLGALVHVSVTDQTTGQARERALTLLKSTTKRYEAGSRLAPGAGLEPPGLPAELRALAARGERGTMLAERRGRPVMWAA